MRKNILKLSILAIMALFAGFACSDDDDYPLSRLEVDLDSKLIQMSEDGGSKTFKVLSNRDWEVKGIEDIDWIQITPMKAYGDAEMTVTVLPNTGDEPRKVEIKIESTTLTEEIAVSQAGKGGVLPPDPTPDAGDALFFTSFGKGATNDGGWPFLDKWIADGKDLGIQGTATKDVTFESAGMSLRTSGIASEKYPNASAGNNVWMAEKEGNYLEVKDIKVGDNNVLMLRMGGNYYDFESKDSEFKPEYLDMFYSVDGGASYIPVEYQVEDVKSAWVFLVVNDIIVPVNSTVSFKLVNKAAIRVDDFGVFGKNDPDVVEETAVVTSAATDLTEVSAMLNGSYTPQDADATKVGFMHKADGGEYVTVELDAVANPFTYKLEGLTESTDYTYKAFAVIGGKTVEGSEVAFKTAADVGDKEYVTMDKVREYEGKTIDKNLFVKATVLEATNTTSTAWNYAVADETAGISIRLAASLKDRIPQGNVVEIELLNVKVGRFKDGALQLESLPLENFVDTKETAELPYTEITVEQLFSQEFESQYVGVKDVQVIAADLDKNLVWEEKDNKPANSNIIVEARSGENFNIYTTFFSAIADKKAPQKSGLLKGVAGRYVNDGVTTFQIMPQHESDWAGMTNDRFDAETPDTPTTVATHNVIGVTETTATVGGEFVVGTGATATAAGVEWTTKGGNNWTKVAAANVTTSPFTVEITGLTANTEYDFRVYLTVDGADKVGETKSFRTVNPDAQGGGESDFSSMKANMTYDNYTTANKWEIVSGQVLEGGDVADREVHPIFSTSSADKCVVIRTERTGTKGGPAGSITSPLLEGGIGEIDFRIGLPYLDREGVDLKIQILKEGEMVKEENLVLTKDEITPYGVEVKTSTAKASYNFNVDGSFQIKIINNKPANSSNKERVAFEYIKWTGYSK